MYTMRKCTQLPNWTPRHRAVLKAELIWWYWPSFPIVLWPLFLCLQAGGKLWAVAMDFVSICGHKQRKRDVSSSGVFFRPSKNFPRSAQPTLLNFIGHLETNHWQDNRVFQDSLDDDSVSLTRGLLPRAEWSPVRRKVSDVLHVWPGPSRELGSLIMFNNCWVNKWITMTLSDTPLQNYDIYNQYHLLDSALNYILSVVLW